MHAALLPLQHVITSDLLSSHQSTIPGPPPFPAPRNFTSWGLTGGRVSTIRTDSAG